MAAQFSAQTRAWFDGVFARPTPAQDAAWEAIGNGGHTLVVAPTGSGKTLAAFLWAVDRLASEQRPVDVQRRTRVLYISPLKALAVDIERNLRAPLTGIAASARQLGVDPPEVTVAVRSGDTPAADRQRFLRRPSDILITTPESLYLMVTSRAREALRAVETVIVDEVHAVAGTKRGAHLALTLERLDAFLERPAQRIGLSATVRPVDVVARFLGGSADVQVVQPANPKSIDLSVVVPVEDLRSLDQPDDTETEPRQAPSVWPHVESRIVDLIETHRSTIVFANSRRLAERLSSRLNEVWFERRAASEDDTDVEIARAHHGSVSREQRQQIEEDLKAGRLPAVVATSSLELGIDMGSVDLVVQVEAPPSVASGLQRIGRAEHRVDGVSRGVLFPKHRGDLVPTAVTVERMHSGQIEALSIPRNPLDVLAQHIVAMVAMDDWTVADLTALVGRAAPFHSLPSTVLDAVLDMLAGRYPSDAFAELKPRLVWDRDKDLLTTRPGAQRVAVINGGTIPDRGLYGVFIASGDERGPGRRVGELDEEMVYESRVGDVFALGSTSWRIEEITHDQVLVSPAPGQPGKLPFWHGDAQGRPEELGRAIGAFNRELESLTEPAARERVLAAGLDEWAADNLLTYLAEQRQSCHHLPTDRTIVFERFRDEIGDWRLVIHSSLGGRVNTPWSLVIADQMRDDLGIDVQVMPSDDGIVLRLPDMEAADDEPPDITRYLVVDPDSVESAVTQAVAGSALFASRFRECAARALLLPRRRPDRRTPLWQQRQRAAQLLSVAGQHAQFPIVLETMRECLQDVFDVPGLRRLMTDVQQGTVRVVDIETTQPSPFARSLLFSYIGAFLYEGDAPLAERRAQALSLDSSLLAELLGQAELRELLDADAIQQVEQELQRLTPSRAARDAEDAADLLRLIGPLSTEQAQARGVDPSWLEELSARRRAVQVRLAGQPVWAAVEDVGRLRDAVGVPPPMGIAAAMLETLVDPVGDLVSRYARTHGPFTVGAAATALALGPAVVETSLRGLQSRGRVVSGEFVPGASGTEWCDAEVLRMIRRRSLAALRHQVEPVPPSSLARFLPAWQEVGTGLRGAEGLLRVVEQLQGAYVPASALETFVLPTRVSDYNPAQLDELLAAGEIRWLGRGSLPGHDGWVTLAMTDQAPDVVQRVDEGLVQTPAHQAIVDLLGNDNALFFRSLADRIDGADQSAVSAALWDLVWAGAVTNDTMAPLRAYLEADRTTPDRRARYRQARRPRRSMSAPADRSGRWTLTPKPGDDVSRALALATNLLDRYGIVTRGSVAAERHAGGFAAVYRVLAAMEDAGRTRRGYYVEGLGAAQFGLTSAIDLLRNRSPAHKTAALLLAATDPANPYGAALSWPSRTAGDTGHLPGRKAGAAVAMVDGELCAYVERGGRSLLTWSTGEALDLALDELAQASRSGRLGRVTVERVNGEPVFDSSVAEPLSKAGFRLTPRGYRLGPSRHQPTG